jgi:hypothetical protein
MKYLALFVTVFGFNSMFSQIENVEIVTKQNDTLKNITLKMPHVMKINLITQLQEKIKYVGNDGSKKELLPADVSSFSLTYDNDILRFENIQDKGFAQEFYSNKLKLFRLVTPHYNVYIIKKPDGKVKYLEAMGLSRLISKKVISREMADCPITIKKVEDKVLSVHGEAGVIELVKDYEANCL